MKTPSLILLASSLALTSVACRRETKTEAPAVAAVAPVAPTSGSTASGPVLETMDASSYTYVRIKTDKGDLWAAGPMTKVAVGEKVVITLDMPMANFHSSSLNRDFPMIYFTNRLMKEGEAAAAPAAH